MSKEIDWSQAPKSAEYAGTISGEQIPVFYRNVKLNSFEYNYGDKRGWIGPVSGQPSCTPIIPRPTTPSWSGEGLPPVGVVCQFLRIDDCQKETLEEGAHVKIIAHYDCMAGQRVAAFTYDHRRGRDVESAISECFRPIRPIEQVAADERNDGIAEIVAKSLGRCDSIGAAYLYDDGYRKEQK